MSNLIITDLVVDEGHVLGAVALDVEQGKVFVIQAGATVLAAGGLTDLYARTSASACMTGDSYALAARAGAQLMDMEMVQFFPIGTLFPRIVGYDPVMWDPFRYKLGGRLLNGKQEEFIDRYGSSDEGKYTATRDLVSYAIFSEVAAGRGSPHGGAFVDFRDVPQEKMYEAWGGVIDDLLAQGLDLTKQQVEVSPIAHFMIGGIVVDTNLETSIPGLFAAGEATGGTHGANRLSGNALTEAIVHGAWVGETAANYVRAQKQFSSSQPDISKPAADLVKKVENLRGRNVNGRSAAGSSEVGTTAAAKRDLRRLMWDKVGPLRDGTKLQEAVSELKEMETELLPKLAVAPEHVFNLQWVEALELENMVQVAQIIAQSALARGESRGAHQRLDFVESTEEYLTHFVWGEGSLQRKSVGGSK